MHKTARFLPLSWLLPVELFQLVGACTEGYIRQEFALENKLKQHAALLRGRFAHRSCLGRDGWYESSNG